MIKLDNIKISYDRVLLENGSMRIPDETLTLITGLSGTGKSTLLYRVGMISDQCDYGYEINGETIDLKDEKCKSQYRRVHFGYVMQDASLYEQYDVLGNLKLYASFAGKEKSEEAYLHLLSLVHLQVPLHQSIETLSGGERQRLAIACALCKDPEVLILDEPTSALDKKNETIVLEVLKQLAHVEGKCIVMASHSALAKEYADQIYSIKDKTLICEKQYQGTSTTWKEEKQQLSLSFFTNYIRYFFQKYKSLNVIMITAMILCMSASTLSLGFIDAHAKSSYEALERLTDKQLFITDDKSQMYMNGELPVMKDMEKLKLEDGDSLYPYHKMMISVNGLWVSVVPYFDGQDFSDKMLRKMDLGDHQGVYFSHQLYVDMKDMAFVDNQFDASGVVFDIQDGEDMGYPFEKSFLVKGVLDKNIHCPYLKDEKSFIYMYYKEIDALYQKYSSQKDTRGYILCSNNLQSLMKDKDEAKALGFGVNEGQVNLDALNTLAHTTQNLRFLVLGGFLIVFILMLSALQINYFYKRKREFALLSVNGLAHRDLHKLSLMEIVGKIVLSLIISMIVSGIVWMVLSVSGLMQLEIDGIAQLIFYVILFAIVVLVTMIYSVMFFRKNQPENILRN